MPLPIVPIVLACSTPVTMTFLGATFHENVLKRFLEPPLTEKWAIQDKKGNWMQASDVLSRRMNEVLAEATDEDAVQEVVLVGTDEGSVLGATSWYIDFKTMQLVEKNKNGFKPAVPQQLVRRKILVPSKEV